MLLCLHEEAAVAIAHGWAKVKDAPLCAIVHSNVGLMHASMAVFNAWCDRAPLLLLGATGPVDAAKRRPWIDWIHTAKDQGALIRDYTKWDDQPASVPAALKACCARGRSRKPRRAGLCMSARRCAAGDAPRRCAEDARRVALRSAPARRSAARLARRRRRETCEGQAPLLLMGRMSRNEDHWAARIALAEKLGALVLTDMKIAGAFPTTHAQHAAAPSTFPARPHANSCARRM